MSNFQTTVSIADIYGAEWWERNKAELDREWEWEFRIVRGGELICDRTAPSIEQFRWSSETSTHCRIILHRRKPKPPTLWDVYGTDKVEIPQGWEWAGEWRVADAEDVFLGNTGAVYTRIGSTGAMLILRERPKKVWFKAEERMRNPKKEDWIWCETRFQWELSAWDFKERVALCATRHEEIDDTVQPVTQADIDRLQKENN